MKDIQTRTFQLNSPSAKAKLSSGDFAIFEARPSQGTPIKGGIVIVQEIFGVNAHIRSVTEDFARHGYLTWAPAYFDHVERGLELDYSDSSMTKGREIVTKIGWDLAVDDTDIAARNLKEALAKNGDAKSQKISVIGYCWGGSVAWFMSTRKPGSVDKCISYYGSAVLNTKTETPKTPIILHFGELDKHIPIEGVKEVAKLHPTVPVYTYPADHGFNRTGGAAAELALKRTLEFIES